MDIFTDLPMSNVKLYQTQSLKLYKKRSTSFPADRLNFYDKLNSDNRLIEDKEGFNVERLDFTYSQELQKFKIILIILLVIG